MGCGIDRDFACVRGVEVRCRMNRHRPREQQCRRVAYVVAVAGAGATAFAPGINGVVRCARSGMLCPVPGVHCSGHGYNRFVIPVPAGAEGRGTAGQGQHPDQHDSDTAA